MDIELTLERDGFYGLYHEGTKYPDVVILRTAGSGAPKGNVISCSKFLFEAGYSVLCIGYYMWGTLGDVIDEIPLDYVEKAISWVRSYTGNSNLRIGITGLSQGASYALAAAARIPDISAVAAASPFDHVMEGNTNSFRRTGHSSYTWHGEPLPYTRWKLLDASLPKLLFHILRDKEYGISRMMRYGYDKNGIDPVSAIEVENMHADLLLLASKDDDCWPSDEAVPRMVERLRVAGYSHHVESHIYERGCHNMGGDMTLTGKTGKKMKRLMRSWADHPDDCLACIEDSKERILTFFENVFSR